MTYYNSPEIKNREYQTILGTILGGSSIVKPQKGKNCYLSMRDKNGRWLEYKAIILEKLSSEAPFTIDKTNRWHSCCYPIFNEFKENFYDKNNQKTISIDKISPLNDFGFSIWYGDCGKLIKEKNLIVLNLKKWNNYINIFIEYFKIIGMNPSKFQNNKLLFNEKDTKTFMKIISPHLPLWF